MSYLFYIISDVFRYFNIIKYNAHMVEAKETPFNEIDISMISGKSGETEHSESQSIQCMVKEIDGSQGPSVILISKSKKL